tara:strand:+ start:268 stop:498 length:231 start_codon:yes stop_codon:yes gene_type:complete
MKRRIFMDNPMVSKSVECRLCGAVESIVMPVSSFLAWQGGEFIQDAMPFLSSSQREMLISQTCDDCWTNLFGEDEE